MKLWRHQERAVARAKELGGSLCIFYNTGLGKTLTAMEIAKVLGVRTILVLAPKSVGIEWQRNLPTATILTYQAFAKLPTWKNEIDLLICDESHAIKNPRSLRYKSIRKLKAKHRLMLSATPAPRSEIDYLTQVALVSEGCNANYYKLRAEFFSNLNEGTYRKFPNFQLRDKEAFYNWLNEYSVFEDEASEIVLPELKEIEINFLQDEDLLNLEALKKAVREGTQLTILTELNNLRHVSSIDPLRLAYAIPHIVNEYYNHPIVWGYDRKAQSILNEELKSRGLVTYVINGETKGRSGILEKHKNEGGVLLATLGTLSEGVNLQYSSASIFFDYNFNYASIYQARARNYRAGSLEEVRHYYMRGSSLIDKNLKKSFKKKQSIRDNVLLFTKDILNQEPEASLDLKV